MVLQAAGSPVTFSTAGLPVSRRMELWEQYNARAFVRMTCRTLGDEPLEATERNVRTRGLRLAHITAGPHIAERTAREIERHPTGTVVLTVVLAGETCAYYRDGAVTLKPGQAILADTDVPSMRGFAHGVDQLHLTVPKTVYQDLVHAEIPQPYRVFEMSPATGGSAQGTALVRLIGAAVRGDDVGDPHALERDVLASLRAVVVGPRAGDPSAQLAAAQEFVRQHLGDPMLSAARIAAGLGVSERQVSRIFSAHGGVAGWVTDVRLDRALALLSEPGHRSVGQVVRECGFGSHSYFTRVFRQRFGVSPRDVLNGSGAPAGS
ncbi:AraC family transcriptional regulator [Streptomyces sp. NPDC047081]|uniref:AraC family transcriptional regulator n=1 Tax=Streptomyces sp. NPDC047081 TaxID=3154706 RepID=UPI0033D05DE4